MVAVVRHLFEVRDTILRVNQEYIRSAAQEDAYRTEPPFKLQGSYRNMNRIAEKVLPLMTREEVRGLILDHYRNESQTLTQGAEANLLKFKEFEGIASEQEKSRWADIKKEFMKRRLLGGAGEEDPVGRVVAQLSGFQDGLDAIKSIIAETGREHAKPQTLSETTVAHLREIIQGLRAVPVEVDIKVVPVQESSGPIKRLQHLNRSEDPPLEFKPEVRQGIRRLELRDEWHVLPLRADGAPGRGLRLRPGLADGLRQNYERQNHWIRRKRSTVHRDIEAAFR